jgi:hypothetical protein
MTAHQITVTPKAASGPGALDGWQARCTCGDVQSTSLSEHEARMLGQKHLDWHARNPARVEQVAVHFTTRPFELSHGRLPRGTGSWAFASYEGGRESGEPVFFFGTLTEAKRQARKHFAARGIVDVAVLP